MKTFGIFIAVAAFAAVMYALAAGIGMVIIGAIGHIFNVELFTQVSFGESLVMMMVYGLIGVGVGNNG